MVALIPWACWMNTLEKWSGLDMCYCGETSSHELNLLASLWEAFLKCQKTLQSLLFLDSVFTGLCRPGVWVSFQEVCFLFMQWLRSIRKQAASGGWNWNHWRFLWCWDLAGHAWICCGWFSCYLPLPSMTLLSSSLPSWKLMWSWNIFVPFLFWFDVMWCLWRIRGNSNSSFILHFLSSELDNCFLPRKDKIPEPLLLLNSILLSLLSSEPPHNYYSLHETLPLDFLFFYLFLWIRGWNVSWKIIL